MSVLQTVSESNFSMFDIYIYPNILSESVLSSEISNVSASNEFLSDPN
jgi:hypothetical protein